MGHFVASTIGGHYWISSYGVMSRTGRVIASKISGLLNMKRRVMGAIASVTLEMLVEHVERARLSSRQSASH